MCWVLVLTCGIFHCSPQTLVVVCGLSCSVAGKNLVPWPRIKPEYSALQGRFLTTVPQGSPYAWILCVLSSFSRVQLFVTLWTVARQAPLSMGFPKQEYWSGLPFSSPGDLPDSWIEPGLPHCRQSLYRLSHQGSYRRFIEVDIALFIYRGIYRRFI